MPDWAISSPDRLVFTENRVTRRIFPARNVSCTQTRDAKVATRRELTKGNLFSARLFGQYEIRRLFVLEPDGRRTSPDQKSGEAILICEIFTLDLAHNSRPGKRSTVLFCALNRKTRPLHFQLAGPLSRKSQKQLLLATQTASSEGARCPQLGSGLLSASTALQSLAGSSETLTFPHPPRSLAFRAVVDA
jgi:hypothetical protein